MDKRDDIGNRGNVPIDENHLLAYLEGTMPAEEQHHFEEILEENPFLRDAVDGLTAVKDKKQLRIITAQINEQLKGQIKKRRNQRHHYRPKLTDHWGWIFVLIMLLLLLISWMVIKMTVTSS